MRTYGESGVTGTRNAPLVESSALWQGAPGTDNDCAWSFRKYLHLLPPRDRYLCSVCEVQSFEGQVPCGGRNVQHMRREVGWNLTFSIAEGTWRGSPVYGYVSHVKPDNPNADLRKFMRALGVCGLINPYKVNVDDLLHCKVLVCTNHQVTRAGIFSVAERYDLGNHGEFLELGKTESRQMRFCFWDTIYAPPQKLPVYKGTG